MCIIKEYLKPSKKMCAEGKRLYNFVVHELEEHRVEIQNLRTQITMYKEYFHVIKDKT